MKRREFLSTLGAVGAAGAVGAPRATRAAAIEPANLLNLGCDCEMQLRGALPPGFSGFKDVVSNLRITGIKTFGVTLPQGTGRSDRPYIFVKVETNQGVVGWGEATLEGKGAAAMTCVNDLHDYFVGLDPMQVEHAWQMMYIGSFYRGGPVIGSAISGIDHALWDIRGKVLGMPVYQLLGGPVDPAGVRGYYHADSPHWTLEQAKEVGDKARQAGVSALKFQLPSPMEWLETNARITHAVKNMEIIREGLGPDIDFAVDFHAKPSPSVSAIILREIEPLHLLFAEEICPPENVRAMQRAVKRSTTPIATGERLIASYGFNELIELGIVDVLQPDCAHAGGITALWKISALADAAGIRMAPHACEGPVGAVASLHVDAAIPNLLAQEICGAVESTQMNEIWAEIIGFPAMRMVNGKYPLPTKPGLGFEIKEETLAKYPFKGTGIFPPSFCPDGSLASQ